MILYRNSEGYADPTVGAAFAHIAYEKRQERREARKQRELSAKKEQAKTAEQQRLLKKRHWEQEQRRLDQIDWKLAWSRDRMEISEPIPIPKAVNKEETA